MLVETLVDNIHNTLENLKKEIVGHETLKSVSEIEVLVSINNYDNDSLKEIKKEFPDDNGKLKEALNTHVSENDLKNLKIEFPEK